MAATPNFFARDDATNNAMQIEGGGPNFGQNSFYVPGGEALDRPGTRVGFGALQNHLPPARQAQTPISVFDTITVPDGPHEFHPTDGDTWPAPGSVPGTISVPPGAQQSNSPLSEMAQAMGHMDSFSHMGHRIHADSNVPININIPYAPYMGEFIEGEPLFVRKGYGGGNINGSTLEKAVTLQFLNYILAQRSIEEYEDALKFMEMDDGTMEREEIDLMDEWSFMGFFVATTGNSKRGQTVSTSGWGNTEAIDIWANFGVSASDHLGFYGNYFPRSIVKGGRFHLNPKSSIGNELPNMPARIYQLRPYIIKTGRVPPMDEMRQEDSMGRRRCGTWIHVADSATHMPQNYGGMEDVFWDARKKLDADPFKIISSINGLRLLL